MIFNSAIKEEVNKAVNYLEKLTANESIIEIKKVHKNRSNLQNRYVHLLFTLWGAEYGYTTEEAKTVIKRDLGYYYEKNGKHFIIKTSTMDRLEMTVFIDKFRAYSSDNGLYLPSSDEYNDSWYKFENEISRINNQKI